MKISHYLKTKKELEDTLQALRLDCCYGSFEEWRENLQRQNKALNELIELETKYLESITVTL